MTTESLLKKAKKRYYSKTNEDKNIFFKSSFQQYILDCYLNCDPCSYGKKIAKKLIYELDYYLKNVREISDKDDNGDIAVVFPSKPSYNDNLFEYDMVVRRICLWNNVPMNYFSHPVYMEQRRTSFELKVSFLTKSGGFTLRNLKPHQNLSGGHILCLIDCEDNFYHKFFVINYSDLADNLTLHYMNGTKKMNDNMGFKNMGCTFSKNSEFYRTILPKSNRAKGTTISDLAEYFVDVEKKMKLDFYNGEDYLDLISQCKKLGYSYAPIDKEYFDNYEI